MIDFLIFHVQRPLDKAKMIFQKQTLCSGSGGPGDGRLRGPPPGVFNIVRQVLGRGKKNIFAIRMMKVHNICFSLDVQGGVQF